MIPTLRQALRLTCAIILWTACLCTQAADDKDGTNNIPIVDCHVHLWDTNRPEGIHWPRKEHKTLFRPFMPKQHEPIARANNVRGVVVVQAGQTLGDNQWNLDATAHNKQLYRGIVGNLSLAIGTEKFRPLFEKLCGDKRYVGYRLSGRYQEHLTDDFYRDLQLTASKGKTVDFLVGGYSFEEISQIAKRVPNLKIILDHFGGVQLDDQPLDPTWVKRLRNVAQCKNVYCKVSALYGRTNTVPAPAEINYYKPVIDLVFDNFGEDRLIFGSDWPVTERTGNYASVVKLTKAYFDRKGRSVSEKLFYRNAIKFYGIPALE
jgi:L-fuconolactonase